MKGVHLSTYKPCLNPPSAARSKNVKKTLDSKLQTSVQFYLLTSKFSKKIEHSPEKPCSFKNPKRNLNQFCIYLQATTDDSSSLFLATALPRPSYANLLLFTIRGQPNFSPASSILCKVSTCKSELLNYLEKLKRYNTIPQVRSLCITSMKSGNGIPYFEKCLFCLYLSWN